MDPNSSIGRICLGKDNRVSLNDKVEIHGEWDILKCNDTANSGQKKEAKAFTFYQMETEEISCKERIDSCFKRTIYFMKFIINPEEEDIEPVVVFGRSFMRLTKGITNLGNGIITIYPDLDPFLDVLISDDSEDRWMGKSSRIKKKPCKNYKMKYNDEGPSLTVNRDLTRKELSREELEKDNCERILDGELELDEVEANEEMVKEYKEIKEKDDPGAFVLPIRLEGRYDTYALPNTGSNINIIPYCIFKKLGREQIKPVRHNVSMLKHSEAELMGILKDVLCQVGITIIRAKFLDLDIPVDHIVPIIVGRIFLHNCGGIINTLVGTTSTFDGDSINPFWNICVWKKVVSFLGSLPAPLHHTEWVPRGSEDFVKEVGDRKWNTKIRVTDPAAKTRYNTNLAHLLPKQIYSPYNVDWGLLNNMGYAKEIEATLEIKVYEVGGQEEIFSSEAWRRLFDINEQIYTELLHEFYSTYKFDEDLCDRMGNMEIHHWTLEWMARRQLYHTDRYARLFEYMAGQYQSPLQGDYAPPSYDEDNEELCQDATV
ncbi:DNA-directed DNA polymerase [Tanacetum coccineum]